jgi:hypothetical protein
MWFLEVDGAPLCLIPGWGLSMATCGQANIGMALGTARVLSGHFPGQTIGAVSLDHCPGDTEFHADSMTQFKSTMAPRIKDLNAITPEQLEQMNGIPVRTCPRCGTVYQWYPACSRWDNKTDICSLCGSDEALLNFGVNTIPMMNIKPKWLDRIVMKKEIRGKEEGGEA